MIELKDKKECCGCEACLMRCPVQCISLVEDREGFLYPQIETATCIDCGECDRVCPELNPLEPALPLRVVVAKAKSDDIRRQSSSGGVFTHLAEQVIARGGVVFGAAFDKQWGVCHACATNLEELVALRGSKYSQSRIGKSFVQAEEALSSGREVLFSGTPCQIAALKLFLGREYDNLLAVDIACHGVPSPKVWREYLASVAEPSTITKINFRDKSKGWHDYSLAIDAAGVEFRESHVDNLYMQGFIKNFYLRPSCYACPSKGGRSQSDVTLADCWNIRRFARPFDDDGGVSLTVVGSRKADALLSGLELLECSMSEAIGKDSPLVSSATEPTARAEFFSAIDGDMLSKLRELLQVPFYTTIIRIVKRKATKLFKL